MRVHLSAFVPTGISSASTKLFENIPIEFICCLVEPLPSIVSPRDAFPSNIAFANLLFDRNLSQVPTFQDFSWIVLKMTRCKKSVLKIQYKLFV